MYLVAVLLIITFDLFDHPNTPRVQHADALDNGLHGQMALVFATCDTRNTNN